MCLREAATVETESTIVKKMQHFIFGKINHYANGCAFSRHLFNYIRTKSHN